MPFKTLLEQQMGSLRISSRSAVYSIKVVGTPHFDTFKTSTNLSFGIEELD